MNKNLLCFLITLFSLSAYYTANAQGVTTSSMNGRISDQNGEGLPGATVVALHEPSGTQYGNVTNADGYFRLPNMRVGGPYSVKVTYVGFDDYEESNIYLTLGQTFNLDVALGEGSTELESVTIIANQNDLFDGNKTGAETVVTVERINETPTVGRALADFVRYTPQARIEEGGDGFEISVAGVNNRYNAIYIDGAVNNDVFGLAASGTNGGQTGVSPYPIDAIEQFNVSIAPFDVRQSGFAGAAVNAITRSGTNDFEGSAYYFFRNQNLAGKTPAEDYEGVERTKLPDFSSKTYGVRLGGPIIKDKLFFFVNGEIERSETPDPFNIGTYIGDASESDINNLVNTLQNEYGYNPGTYTDNTSFLNSEKFIAKLDYNINANHKLSVRHSYVNAENLEARGSSTTSISFENGSELFNSQTNSTSIELRSNFTNMSNRFIASFNFVRDDRDPSGNPFPTVTIADGDGTIQFGAEPFSTANLLEQDAIALTNNFELYKGRHTLLLGANAEFYRALNLFISYNYGNYEWSRISDQTFNGSNLADFIAGEPAEVYFRNYSQVDNITGDGSASGVVFNSALFGLYVQDEFQANNNLKLTLGVRADVQMFEDTPENEDFNTNVIPQLSQFYDLQGARTGDFIAPQIYLSPRFGFNWDVTGEQTTQVRGGIGLFTSRIPLVWPGAAYNNNGINLGGTYREDDSDTPENEGQPFIADIDQQPPTDLSGELQRGDVDIFAEDFKIPQVLKINLAVDQKLPGDIVATVDFLYNKFYNNLYYQNVNVDPRGAQNLTGTGNDDRLVFTGNTINGDYGDRIILASNINKGYTYSASLNLNKAFASGINANVSYSYGDAYAVYEGTSSQNSSQWRYRQTVSPRNFNRDLNRSQFSPGSRVLAQFSYAKEYGNFFGSQISLVFEGRSGNPYSFLIGDGDDMVDVDSNTPELAYIPANANEINMSEEDYAILNDLIEANDYLRENRGKYAESNRNRAPFESFLDMRFLQNFYVTTAGGKRNTLQLSVDIFNLTNLLNKNWGKIYQREDDRFNYNLYDFEGFEADGTTPIYSANDYENNEPYYNNLDDEGIRSSRWQMQLGVRYIFGN